MARGPQKTTRLVRGGPLVTIILSNRTITTHNNGQYKTHYRYSRKSKTFVLNDCNVKIEVTEFGKEFQILGPWNLGKLEKKKSITLHFTSKLSLLVFYHCCCACLRCWGSFNSYYFICVICQHFLNVL